MKIFTEIDKIFIFSCYITYEDMRYKTNTEKLNEINLQDFSNKTSGDFRRQLDKDITQNRLNSINWESESKYHSYYHGHLPCRTIGGSKKQIESLMKKFK